MSAPTPSAPEAVSIKQMLASLTLTQVVSVVTLFVAFTSGVFALGAFAEQIRSADSHVREQDAANALAAKPYKEQLEKQAETYKATLATRDLQIQFLDRWYSYVNARINGEWYSIPGNTEAANAAKNAYLVTLRNMYHGGNAAEQRAQGYLFSEQESLNHAVTFLDGNKSYQIPRDVKGDFIDRELRMQK